MNSPRQPDGPPIRDGKPYSALVHLAEDVTPFVAVGRRAPGARAVGAGRSMPSTSTVVFSCSRTSATGCSGPRWRAGGTMWELWARRRRCAARPCARRRLRAPADRRPRALPASGLRRRRDADRGLAPHRLVLAGAARQGACRQALREEFTALWRPLLADAAKSDLGWVLRDYHSPNLMWLPEREGAEAGRHPRLPGRP